MFNSLPLPSPLFKKLGVSSVVFTGHLISGNTHLMLRFQVSPLCSTGYAGQAGVGNQ